MDNNNLESIRRKLKSIKMQATRHKRGTREHNILLRDLEFIETLADKALKEIEKQ